MTMTTPHHTRKEPFVRLKDNPLLTAQTRRSFRESTLVKALIVPAVLGICALVAGQTRLGPWQFDFADELLMMLIGFFLLLQAPSRMSSLMAQERNSGILEFHQATPTSGWTDALGYLVGGTIRHYVRAFVLIPFLLIATLLNDSSFLDALGAVLILCTTGIMYQLLAMLLGLIGGKRGFFGTLATAIPIILILFGQVLVKADITILAHLTPYPALIDLSVLDAGLTSAGDTYTTFVFGMTLSPLFYTIVYHLFVASFLFWAVARKLRRTDATVFSKPGAFIVYGVLSILLMSDLYSPALKMGRFALFVYLQTTVILGVLITTFICPTLLQYLRRKRRLAKDGASRSSHWADSARVWATTGVFGLVWIALFYLVSERFVAFGVAQTAISIESALLCLQVLGLFAFTAAVCEYAHFASGKSALATLGLVVLIFVIVPWVFFAVGHLNETMKPLGYLGVLSPTYGTLFSITYYVSPLDKLPITNGTEHLSHLFTWLTTGLFLWQTRTRLNWHSVSSSGGVNKLAQ
ncbi:MAG: hypothetical protein VYA30_01195 [Myxococcota bacterium]|nr:hypothetical protein [Myxococcota bacterium]